VFLEGQSIWEENRAYLTEKLNDIFDSIVVITGLRKGIKRGKKA
jgi:hypothetical protein